MSMFYLRDGIMCFEPFITIKYLSVELQILLLLIRIYECHVIKENRNRDRMSSALKQQRLRKIYQLNNLIMLIS
jgi:hypothetical protein